MKPAWFCAAAHDEKGDDLRRRWDDPRLETIDDHPVVYPGAGSHATYLERGEYIMLLPFPGERNIRGPLDLIRRVVARHAVAAGSGRPGGPREAGPERPVRRLRARRRPVRRAGRRRRLGRRSSSATRTAGSRATRACGASTRATGSPASAPRPDPKFTRTGSVRQSWHDPLGFAGLDKVAPPSQAIAALEARIAELASDTGRGDRGSRGPRGRSAQARCRGRRHPERQPAWSTIASSEDHRAPRRRGSAAAPAHAGGRARRGHRRRPRAARGSSRRGGSTTRAVHLHHAAVPEPPSVAKRRAFGEAWAALSVGLLIAALAVIVWFQILPPPLAHRRPVRLVPRHRIVLRPEHRRARPQDHRDPRPILSSLILAVTYLRELFLLALLALGLLLIVDNIGEIRRRLR